MAKATNAWTKAREAAKGLAGNDLPDGKYIGRVLAGSMETTNDGPKIKVVYIVTRGEHARAKFADWQATKSEENKQYAAAMLEKFEAAGVTIPWDSLAKNPDDLSAVAKSLSVGHARVAFQVVTRNGYPNLRGLSILGMDEDDGDEVSLAEVVELAGGKPAAKPATTKPPAGKGKQEPPAAEPDDDAEAVEEDDDEPLEDVQIEVGAKVNTTFKGVPVVMTVSEIDQAAEKLTGKIDAGPHKGVKIKSPFSKCSLVE